MSVIVLCKRLQLRDIEGTPDIENLVKEPTDNRIYTITEIREMDLDR